MAKKTADQIVRKYQTGISGAGQAYAEGVQNPSRPWAQSTAGAADRWRTGVQNAIANNKFAQGVSKAGDAKWQRGALEKGAANFAAAAPLAAEAYASRAGEIMNAANAAQSAVANMPAATQEQRLQRAIAAMKATSAYWANR